MTQTNTLRPAMTAIAAALAFYATPLIAQETTSPAEPVVDAPTSSGPVTTADPLAPDPAASEAPAKAAPLAAPAKASATPAARPTATRRATTARAAPARRAPTQLAAAAPQAAAPEAAPAAEPASPPLAAEPAISEPAPVAADASDAAIQQAERTDLIYAIAAAAIAILALGLLWMLIRRRRRAALYDEEEWVAEEAPPVIDAEPAVAAAPMAEPMPAPEPRFAPPAYAASAPRHDPVDAAPAADLPEGFDLSRFGPHMQAAYRGPTPDNPSLSLKYRLSKAAALDQRERLLAEQQAAEAPPMAASAPASPEPGFLLGDKDKTVVRRAYSEDDATR